MLGIFAVKSILLALGFMAVTTYAENANICAKAEKQMAEVERQMKGETQRTFSVGLWDAITPAEKSELSDDLKSGDSERASHSVTTMVQNLSERLQKERSQFVTWVKENNLSNEIEVQGLPADNSSITFKATRKGVDRVLCAAASGQISALLLNLGS